MIGIYTEDSDESTDEQSKEVTTFNEFLPKLPFNQNLFRLLRPRKKRRKSRIAQAFGKIVLPQKSTPPSEISTLTPTATPPTETRLLEIPSTPSTPPASRRSARISNPSRKYKAWKKHN